MLEVKQQNGEIIFPKPDPRYLNWLETGKGSGDKPRQGGIPNRFLARVDDAFQASKVEKAVKTAWRELAEAVWRQDFGSEYAQTPTRLIWERQINGFWDIAWAIVTDRDDTGVLDRRKNWRSHYLQPEPGQKCMMLEGMQELSGAERAGEGQAFWTTLADKVGEMDLRDSERLCAIAYVKRRLLQGFNARFRAVMPSGWTTHGWDLPGNVPSVTYLAAAPFLVEALQKNPQAVAGFYGVAGHLAGHGEWNSNIKCIRDTDAEHRWTALDGHVFFEAELRNGNMYPADQTGPVLRALQALRQVTGSTPSPYYALLLMDGDSLGKQMTDADKRELISTALNDFTGAVAEIVEQQYSGFLIYAGGDDVLALLTLDDALDCANALQQRYVQAFAAQFAKVPVKQHFPATLSGAIEYAHYRLPFTKILADAHELLDEHAKDDCGRDAIAARVWKQSGLHLTYVQPWQIALCEHDGLPEMVRLLCREQGNGDTPVAGSFFYRLRELFGLLNSGPSTSSGRAEGGSGPSTSSGRAVEKEDLRKLLRYEYLHSGLHENQPDRAAAHRFIDHLLVQCQINRRDADRNIQATGRYSADAGLLARFLANRGNERY